MDGSTVSGPLRRPASGAPIAIGATALIAAAFVFTAIIATLGGGSLGLTGTSAGALDDGVSALGQREIPSLYLRLYRQAARLYGLDWAMLAGIGKVECDHGRDPDPACTQEGAMNSAGAGGPMQFIASTWARYGADADGDGRADRWDAADAIYGAAHYLHVSGAPGDYRHAILAYNHAGWYADEVESWASRYRGHSTSQGALERPGSGEGADVALAQQTAMPVRFIAGERARLAPEDGRVALIPAAVPALVQALLVAGNELQGLPYGPGGHPDPRGAYEEDCSSTLNYVLYRAGVRPIGEIVAQNPVAQDYMRWGAPGPGRWVTIYATAAPTPHAFVVIAGLRLDTSHNGTDTGPNRSEDGPRWRILDRIPTWARWSVRHPPGL
jgi:hypothetical protein